MPIIIGISGKMLSGKSYLRDKIAELLKEEGFTVEFVSIARPLKLAVDILLGGHIDKYKDRRIYQEVGDVIRKYKGPYFWPAEALTRVATSDKDVVIIDDIRFPEEIEVLEPNILIRLEIPREIREQRLKNIGQEYEMLGEEHISEIALDNYKDWDFVIKDEEEVEEVAKEVVERVKDVAA